MIYIHYFGERAFYSNDEEKEEAVKYLDYWQKNMLNKLRNGYHEPELVEATDHIRDPWIEGIFCERWTIARKLAIKLKFHFDLDQFLGTASK